MTGILIMLVWILILVAWLWLSYRRSARDSYDMESWLQEQDEDEEAEK